MNRRTLVKTGGMAQVGFGFNGCATKKTVRTGTTPPIPTASRPFVSLAPVRASRGGRVIRTTVGLRPHRDSGVLETGGMAPLHGLVDQMRQSCGRSFLGRPLAAQCSGFDGIICRC